MSKSSTHHDSSRFRYKPEFRFKKRSDFARMEGADVRLHTRPFLLVVAPSPTSESRLGIIITKRIDKRAVVRNRIRRRVREIFRHYRADLKQPLDILVIARKAALSCPFSVMQRQTVAALRRHGYLSSDFRQNFRE